jgi:hypothetical protein
MPAEMGRHISYRPGRRDRVANRLAGLGVRPTARRFGYILLKYKKFLLKKQTPAGGGGPAGVA